LSCVSLAVRVIPGPQVVLILCGITFPSLQYVGLDAMVDYPSTFVNLWWYNSIIIILLPFFVSFSVVFAASNFCFFSFPLCLRVDVNFFLTLK
jgi:hypothetical protein